MINANDRVAAIMGRQMLSIVQLEAELEAANERCNTLQVALKQVSEELAIKSKAVQRPDEGAI